MKKLLEAVVFILIFFFQVAEAKQTKWKRGAIYEGEVTWEKNAKIKLPPGKFKLVISSDWMSWGIKIAGKDLVSTKGDLLHESLSFDRLGSYKYLAYLKIIYEEIFFKNKHDGCYPRSEYTVMKLRKKGGFFNCFIVRHVDTKKAFYNPDDPEYVHWNAKFKYAMKKYNFKVPPMLLCATTYFYVPSISEVVLTPQWCINPETHGASKNLNTTEVGSEYHPNNIDKYPDKKKFMENFIKRAALRHKHFENEMKAKEHHKIDFSEYGIGELIEEIETKSSSSSLVGEFKELNKLYEEGVLTKEEFEKAKKKILN